MAETESLKTLKKLIQLDIDAVFAYDEAIESIDSEPIRSRISEFKRDHERHISDLSRHVRELGGQPPDFSRDFKGFVLEGFTRIRSSLGTEGALKAMRSNEKLTNKTYESALSVDMPAEVKEVVRQNREDERRHLQYIEDVLETKPWEAGEVDRDASRKHPPETSAHI